MPAAPAFQAALGLAAKHRREELELTQEQLSLRSELHQRWISDVETASATPATAACGGWPPGWCSRLPS
jgi:hypothetical protein